MSIKELLTRILNKLKAHDTDYIVEQGTSGIWTYRKWNSGIVDLWGNASVTPAESTQTGSNYYSEVLAVALPFTIQAGATVTATVSASLELVSNISASATAVTFRFVRSIAIAKTSTGVRLIVHGKWK